MLQKNRHLDKRCDVDTFRLQEADQLHGWGSQKSPICFGILGMLPLHQAGNFRNTPTKKVPRPREWIFLCLFSMFNEKFTQKSGKWFCKKALKSCFCHVKYMRGEDQSMFAHVPDVPLNLYFFQQVSGSPILIPTTFLQFHPSTLAMYQHRPTSMSDMSLKFTQPVKDSCTTRRCSSAARAA